MTKTIRPQTGIPEIDQYVIRPIPALKTGVDQIVCEGSYKLLVKKRGDNILIYSDSFYLNRYSQWTWVRFGDWQLGLIIKLLLKANLITAKVHKAFLVKKENEYGKRRRKIDLKDLREAAKKLNYSVVCKGKLK